MRDRAPEALAAAAGLLTAAAAAALFLGALGDPAAADRSAAFQEAAGGLGGGRATMLQPCEAAFTGDRDLPCGRAFEPVPGGAAFCPHHAGPLAGR